MDLDLLEIEHLPIVKVPVRFLKISGSPRRAGENARHVRSLVEAQERLPPITVHRETMRVIDGMHRLRAARLRGEDEIEVRFFEGDEDTSYILGVKSNVAHGLPLSLADRKVAVARIVRLHPEWSDRLVASIAGVAPKTAATVRALSAAQDECPDEQDAQLDMRVGRDGRRRPQNPAERKELAAGLLRKDPSASLRQIARQAGVSPETVRGIRAALAVESGAQATGGGAPGSDTSPPTRLSRVQGHVSPNGDGKKSALNFLRADPAFRSTESGRSLLRLLAFAELPRRHVDTLIAQIPPHCLDSAAKAARECASAWSAFASEIESARSTELCKRVGCPRTMAGAPQFCAIRSYLSIAAA